jgi:hypothetical protein
VTVSRSLSYKFSSSGVYSMPESTLQEGCLSNIQAMPLTARPELFGLHENAEITKEMQETQEVTTLQRLNIFLVVIIKNSSSCSALWKLNQA